MLCGHRILPVLLAAGTHTRARHKVLKQVIMIQKDEVISPSYSTCVSVILCCLTNCHTFITDPSYVIPQFLWVINTCSGQAYSSGGEHVHKVRVLHKGASMVSARSPREAPSSWPLLSCQHE